MHIEKELTLLKNSVYEYPSWDSADLDDHMDSLCAGILKYFNADTFLPQEAVEFIYTQFKRFRVQAPSLKMLQWVWEKVFYYIDYHDPYCLFNGATDVIITDRPYFFQFDFIRDGSPSEIDPELLDHFCIFKGYPYSWKLMMDEPGLENSAFYVAFDFLHELEEYYEDDDEYFSYREHYGKDLTFDLMHMAMWASLMWVSSPMAESWRATFHPVFDLCYSYGECIGIWGMREIFFDPSCYRMLDRPPKTCVMCGNREYCVELTQDLYRQTFAYICEHCLHPEPVGGMACGTRDCTNAGCKYHPGQQISRALLANRRFGDLKKVPGSRLPQRQLPGYMTTHQISKNNAIEGSPSKKLLR